MSGRQFVDAPPVGETLGLLNASSLPVADIDEAMLAHFFALQVDGELVAVAGVEPHGRDGLLRSVAVNGAHRGIGVGRALVAEAERRAAAIGIRNLYLLTDSAPGYFRRLGYDYCDRESAPPSIRRSREFTALCPDDAACLYKRL